MGEVTRHGERRQPRSSAALVVDRNYGPFFWGNIVSNSGNWLFNVTAAIVVFQLSGSAFLTGLVSVGQFLPLMVISPLAGSLSDRFDRRAIVLVGQGLAAVAATVLAVATLVVGLDGLPGAWPVVATALGIGIGQSVTIPALNSMVPALVPEEDLEGGVALTSVTFQIGRALGPIGAGVLLTTLGAEIAFLLNAVSFFVLIAAVLFVTVRPTADDGGTDRSVRAGLRFVRRDRTVMLLLLGVMTAGFAGDPVITLAPALNDVLGGADAWPAAMVSGFGVAAVPTAFLAGRFQRRFGNLAVARVGMLAMAAGSFGAAVSPTPLAALLAFSVTGAGFVLAVTSFTTVLQRHLPDAYRGRVMALWGVAFLGNRPFAAMLDGAAADLVGPRLAMGIAIAVSIAGAAIATHISRRSTAGARTEET